MRSFLKYNWPSILWAVFILYMCLVPGSSLPKIRIPHLDKLVHFTCYFSLAVLMAWGWKKQQSFSWLHDKPLLKILLVAMAYGLSIEIMQELFTADRHFELLDEAANTGGAATGVIISRLFAKS